MVSSAISYSQGLVLLEEHSLGLLVEGNTASTKRRKTMLEERNNGNGRENGVRANTKKNGHDSMTSFEKVKWA